MPVIGSKTRLYSVLTDLTRTHPCQAVDCTLQQARAVLTWMAHFHATFAGTSTSTSGRAGRDGRDHGREKFFIFLHLISRAVHHEFTCMYSTR